MSNLFKKNYIMKFGIGINGMMNEKNSGKLSRINKNDEKKIIKFLNEQKICNNNENTQITIKTTIHTLTHTRIKKKNHISVSN